MDSISNVALWRGRLNAKPLGCTMPIHSDVTPATWYTILNYWSGEAYGGRTV
jgi:hypothetical protein